MSKLALEPPDPKVKQLLDRAAPGIEPSLDAKLRVSSRLTASLLRLPLGRASDAPHGRHAANEGSDSSGGALPRRLARIRPGWLGPAALAFLFGGATASAVGALGTSRPQRIESLASRPAASVPQSIGPNTGAVPSQTGGDAVAQFHLVEETPVASARSAKTRMLRTVAPRAPSDGSGGLAAEQTLLNAARRALAAGRADEALVHLAAHTRAYPETVLAEEREAMQVNALVQSGHYDDARSRATRFVHRFPHSVLLESVTSAVEAIPRQ